MDSLKLAFLLLGILGLYCYFSKNIREGYRGMNMKRNFFKNTWINKWTDKGSSSYQTRINRIPKSANKKVELGFLIHIKDQGWGNKTYGQIILINRTTRKNHVIFQGSGRAYNKTNKKNYGKRYRKWVDITKYVNPGDKVQLGFSATCRNRNKPCGKLYWRYVWNLHLRYSTQKKKKRGKNIFNLRKKQIKKKSKKSKSKKSFNNQKKCNTKKWKNMIAYEKNQRRKLQNKYKGSTKKWKSSTKKWKSSTKKWKDMVADEEKKLSKLQNEYKDNIKKSNERYDEAEKKWKNSQNDHDAAIKREREKYEEEEKKRKEAETNKADIEKKIQGYSFEKNKLCQ